MPSNQLKKILECQCTCACCLSSYGAVGSWFPQRWEIDLGSSWSWSLPSGITTHTDYGPLPTPVETQIDSQEFNAQTIAHPITGLNTPLTAWCFRPDKYGVGFGTIPGTTPYGGTANDSPPTYYWLAADDTSVAQWWHDAYGVVRNSLGYELVSFPATLSSIIFPMVDTSSNSSGATPWRDYDYSSIGLIDGGSGTGSGTGTGTAYDECFTEDIRIGASGYSIPWGIGDECNTDVEWQSGVTTLGNFVELFGLEDGNGVCWWYVKVTIRPRFSIWTNGLFTRAEYYRTASAPSPLTLHANRYIRNGYSGAPPPGIQDQYSGSFGHVHPAMMNGSIYQTSLFGNVGWRNPPTYMPTYATVGASPFGYNDTTRLRNNAGPGNTGLVGDNPPGAWRSWIEITYKSADPINCVRDLDNSQPVTLNLVDDPVLVTQYGYPSFSDGTIPWADWLNFMSDAWGLSTPPSTITIQRLSDL